MSSGALWLSSVSRHVEGIWAFWLKYHEMKFFFLFILLRFTRNPSSLSVMFYVFVRVVQTRQLVLTCALALMPRTLKQLLWYKVALIMKWDAAAWRNLDLEKRFFMKNNLIEQNWSQRLNAAAIDKSTKRIELIIIILPPRLAFFCARIICTI